MSYGTAIKCEECGTVEFIDKETREDKSTPQNWLTISSPLVTLKRSPWHFCSKSCARVWLLRKIDEDGKTDATTTEGISKEKSNESIQKSGATAQILRKNVSW